MTAREFTHWAAYDRIDPIGGERLDALAGHVAAAALAPWGKEGEAPPDPLGLVPDWGGMRAQGEAERKKTRPARDAADDWREFGELSRRLGRGE